ncbi:MAG TPA: YggS family pyridoxal phosphate-dependent enzyme [Chitinophagales bacterium]|nr:YggS family pyridoxal phosphate-dependent enzyme [Chitinophagales bacterium]
MNTENYKALINEIQAGGARLVAISKTQPVEKIAELYQQGQRLFGENKVQELVAKHKALPKDIEWHLVGHLQTNKVKQVTPFVHLIHSVDSLKLLAEINKQALAAGRTVNCLLQVHIAAEETKFGLSDNELHDLLRSAEFAAMKNVCICGLMGMATNTGNVAQVEKEFEHLHLLFAEVKKEFFAAQSCFAELSMGMSGDYKLALKHGATLIRVGSLIFGERI